MSIELLAPAGSPEALDAAVGEGADAVYLGLKTFNARLRSANFTYARFEAALRALRRMGKKLYVTVNTVFEQREADRVYQLLRYLSALGPDALIVQDLGVVAMARSQFPGLKLHASTQMNVASGRGCNALSRHGVSRVVLARELCLEELRSIRAETNVEMEVFAHGALCVGASGLCLFSSFLGGKSANRGMCTQACRRLYQKGETESGYYFSPADLQLLEHLPDLAAAGINAVKIEGRMKSAEYVGNTVAAYRLALDAIAEGDGEKIRLRIRDGKRILRGDFARGKTAFHFNARFMEPEARTETENGVDWLNPAQDGGTGISLGKLLKVQGGAGQRLGLVEKENDAGMPPAAGDSIRLHKSDDSARVSHKLRHAEVTREGHWLSIPDGFDLGDRVYLIQTRGLAKRYRPVTPADAKGGRVPGHEKAPTPLVVIGEKHSGGSAAKKRAARDRAPKKAPRAIARFPEGLYVAVSHVEDLYVAQSIRPAKAMLELNRKTARTLLRETGDPLPFKPADLILTLDPYFPQAIAPALADAVPELVELGYTQFVANNPGHFPLFKDVLPDARSAIRIIAGPWLYAFNAWSLSFLASMGAEGFVSPLENNRQNLERTLDADKRLRNRFFVPVFAWPPLLHVRADLAKLHGFKAFTDSRHENFLLAGAAEGSRVFPAKPFSITDKIPFLRDAGFRRFIVDLSGLPLKKTDYKDLMRAIDKNAPLPNLSRFNWKDGFFNEERPAEKTPAGFRV